MPIFQEASIRSYIMADPDISFVVLVTVQRTVPPGMEETMGPEEIHTSRLLQLAQS